MLRAARSRGEPGFLDDLVDADDGAQPAKFVVSDRADADPVVVLSPVEAVRRGDPHELLVEVWARRGHTADEVRVGREDRTAVEE